MRLLSTFSLALALVLSLVALPAVSQASAQGKKALLIVAKEDFEQTEYATTRKALEDAGVEVAVASTKTGTLKSNKKKRITSDFKLEDVQAAGYDAVVVIGGNGIKKVWKNEDAHRVLREARDAGKIVAAICAGPGVLAYADVLDGVKATANSRSGAKGPMTDHGCQYTGADVEIDGNIITANGPSAAADFGKALVEALGK